MAKDKFVYVTYIRTTPEKLWEALRKPEFTRVYWSGVTQESDWKKGAAWKMIFADGTVGDAGEVVEIDPPRRLVLRWRNEFRPELKAEGYSLCTMEIEEGPGAVKLTIVHEIDQPKSKFIEAVSGGWPKVLASLKSLLETGEALPSVVAKPGTCSGQSESR
ncbi:MAG TPA: SRPBCC family protein [Hyphomicrobium sp.]|nr:SRPBCC family protein [Hyphomicrobium sp.]